MKKSSIFILTLSIILTLFVAVACSNETAVVNDQLAYVSFGQSGSRAFTTGLSNAPGSENLFWVYTAEKTDGKLNTGAGTVPFNGKGITNKTAGPFSVGAWRFTLKAYAEQDHQTLVYQGVSDIVTLNAGRNNSINVDVIYQPKGGNGTLTLDNVYVQYKGTNELKKLKLELVNVDSSANPNSYEYTIENPTTSTEGYAQFSLVDSESKPTKLLAGVYEAKFSFFTSDGTLALPSFIQNIVILNNRVTTVSGCITEDQAVDQTFTVNTIDYGYVESAGKYYVYVNDELALQNALNAAGGNEDAVVVLTCDIETGNIVVNSPASTSRDINVRLAKNVIIDLNGYNLSKKQTSTAEELIKMDAPERILTITNSKSTGKIDAGPSIAASVLQGSLVITGGEVSGSTALKVSAGASAEISGGKLVGTTTALVISKASAEETAASVVISENAEITVTGTEGTIAIKNGGDLFMEGGKISGSTAIQVTDKDASTIVEAGELDSDVTISKDSNVTGNVGAVISTDVNTKEGSDASSDVNTSKFAGSGTENDPFCVGTLKRLNEVLEETISNDTKYILINKSFDLPTVPIKLDQNIVIMGAKGVTLTGNNTDGWVFLIGSEKYDGLNITISNLNLVAKRAIAIGQSNSITNLRLTVSDCYMNVIQRGITVNTNNNSNINIDVNKSIIQCSSVNNYDTNCDVNQNMRGISLWDVKNSTLSLDHTTVQGFAYNINVSMSGTENNYNQGLTINTKNSTFKGRAAFNIYGKEIKLNVDSCNMLGINNLKGPSEGFANIVVNSNAENIDVIINDCTFETYQDSVGINNKNAVQSALSIRNSTSHATIKGKTKFFNNYQYQKGELESNHNIECITITGNDCEFKNLYYGLEPMLASDFASYIEQGSSAKLNDNIVQGQKITVNNDEELRNALNVDACIVLNNDITLASELVIPENKKITIIGGFVSPVNFIDGIRSNWSYAVPYQEIKGRTITGKIKVSDGASLTIRNIRVVDNTSGSAYLILVDGTNSTFNTVKSELRLDKGTCAVKVTGEKASVSLIDSVVNAKSYAVGVRDKQNTINVDSCSLSGWSAIMTSAGDLTGNKSNVDAESSIRVHNSVLTSNPISNGYYGAIVLQEYYNKVTLNVDYCRLQVGSAVGLEEGKANIAIKKTGALDLRSFGNNITITNSELNATGSDNNYGAAPIMLGHRDEWKNANSSEVQNNIISINNSTIHAKEGDKIVVTRRSLDLVGKDSLSIDGSSYSSSEGNVFRTYCLPVIESNSQYIAYGELSKTLSENIGTALNNIQESDILYIDNCYLAEGQIAKSNITLPTDVVIPNNVRFIGVGDAVVFTDNKPENVISENIIWANN